jgi:hypothetical protein
MPAGAIEQLDELTRLYQPHGAILRRVAREPPHRRLVIPLRVIVADQQDETERIAKPRWRSSAAAASARCAFPVLRAR